ncbi:hypothetical protein [Methylobacterium sp. ID0610]|uniref:hypothetical protein n=1 Tax=Methylobacterium carpenticola TaxID=3344827 RepID=UPI0036BAD469
MNWVNCFTFAFLAPVPPDWSGQDRPDPPRVNWWIIALTGWFLLAVSLTPLSLALAEHWAVQRFASRCKMSGGHFTHIVGGGRHPYRCDPVPVAARTSP